MKKMNCAGSSMSDYKDDSHEWVREYTSYECVKCGLVNYEVPGSHLGKVIFRPQAIDEYVIYRGEGLASDFVQLGVTTCEEIQLHRLLHA